MSDEPNPLCDVQKIIPIHQAADHGLVDAWAYTPRVDHCARLLLRFGVQEVVALGAKVEKSLWEKALLETSPERCNVVRERPLQLSKLQTTSVNHDRAL